MCKIKRLHNIRKAFTHILVRKSRSKEFPPRVYSNITLKTFKMGTNYYTVQSVLRKDKIKKNETSPIHIMLQRNKATQKFSFSEFIVEKHWDNNTYQAIRKAMKI